jgi:hypothetical protein
MQPAGVDPSAGEPHKMAENLSVELEQPLLLVQTSRYPPPL